MNQNLALGIDAGGTYTDLVLLDRDSGQVLDSVKSPTTRPDPSGGIASGIARLNPIRLERVGLVSLATTFATNAIVEDQGAEAGLVLIGYKERPGIIPTEAKVVMLSGGHTVSGTEKAPLDLTELGAWLDKNASVLEALAVAGFFSVRNPEHELKAADLIRERYGLPVVRGHRLSMRLDAVKRATTAWWNARLIPLISNLIQACLGVLAEADITAPLMVVRGDGALMSAKTALDRPVDTLLSGPAASILGARHLVGVDDCLIVDMGGTTTDMAVLSEGRVVVDPRGARVGRWETHVEAAKVRTIGLGGDSLIALNGDKNLAVGPRRAIPLCLAAKGNPEIIEHLKDLLRLVTKKQHRHVNPCVFYIARPREATEKKARAPLVALQELVSEYKLWCDAGHWRQSLSLEETERKGIYYRSALTPTDLRVAAGRFDLGDPEGARLGRAVMARFLGLEEVDLTAEVEEVISRRLCVETAAFIGGKEEEEALSILARRWYRPGSGDRNGVGLNLRLSLTAPVVGVGAPAPVCLPQIFEHLNAETLLPEGYDVSVAVGAVVGMVDMTFSGIVRPNGSGGWNLHTTTGKESFPLLEEAVESGRRRLEERARRIMTENHVIDPLLNFETWEQKVASASGDEVHLQTELKLRAAGRPAMG